MITCECESEIDEKLACDPKCILGRKVENICCTLYSPRNYKRPPARFDALITIVDFNKLKDVK